MTQRSFYSICQAFLLGLTVAFAFVACSPESSVGSSLRPDTDLITARLDSLPITVRTVSLDSVYNYTTYSLLGEIVDPVYGDLSTSYISRVQTAPGFKFSHKPVNNRIDSVFVNVSYAEVVGDTLAWLKASVYQVFQRLPEHRYSGSIEPYVSDAKLLGSLTYQPADTSGVRQLRIRIPNELGEKFYDASRNHPDYFDSQDRFEEQLLRGFYVKTSTGSGNIISVYATDLAIYYTYQEQAKTKGGADTVLMKKGLELFSNARHLRIHNSFVHSGLNNLLKPSAPFTYVKAPAGVATEISIAAKDLLVLYKSYLGATPDKDRYRVINDASLDVKVNLPEGLSRFNPPANLLLIARDSVAGFFEKGRTEQDEPDIAFVSSNYSISARHYLFSNIGRLLEKHLQEHARRDASGNPVVDKDLKMLLLPVQRVFLPGGQKTASINNFIYPAAVRLHFAPEDLFIVASSVGYRK